MRYKAHRNNPKGAIVTYYDDSSLIAQRTGLVVSNMAASILSGTAVVIQSQSYDAALNQLAYQINFQNAGEAVVRVTTTFNGTDETNVADYKYRVLDNAYSLDYV